MEKKIWLELEKVETVEEAKENCDYLICLRNPISRAISAFEWRKKLVVSDPPPNQATRFRGEYEVLRAYDSFSDLASKLYQEDTSLNEFVARDFQLIHHLVQVHN